MNFFPRLPTFLCGSSIRTGSLIWLYVSLFWTVPNASSPRDSNDDRLKDMWASLIEDGMSPDEVLAIRYKVDAFLYQQYLSCMITLVLTIVAILGIHMDKSKFLLPLLVMSGIDLGILALLSLFCFILGCFFPVIFIAFFALALGTLIYYYIFLVLLTQYRNMEDAITTLPGPGMTAMYPNVAGQSYANVNNSPNVTYAYTNPSGYPQMSAYHEQLNAPKNQPYGITPYQPTTMKA